MFIAKIYSTFNEFIFFSEYSVLLTRMCERREKKEELDRGSDKRGIAREVWG